MVYKAQLLGIETTSIPYYMEIMHAILTLSNMKKHNMDTKNNGLEKGGLLEIWPFLVSIC